MEIKKVNIDSLRPFQGNPKKHPQEQIDKIMKSLKEYGWTNPVLVGENNMIIAGHARIEAAKKAGIKQVPVIYLPFSGKKAIAYALADNRLAESDWDFNKLASLLIELDDGQFDIELTGFNEEELEEIANWIPKELEEDDFDSEEEARKIQKPKSKRGEIYQLGDHRLMCGDAEKFDDIIKLSGGQKINLIFNDPPYNIGLDYFKGVSTDGKYSPSKVVKDNRTEKQYERFLDNTIKNAIAISNKDFHIFYWCDESYIYLIQNLYKKMV